MRAISYFISVAILVGLLGVALQAPPADDPLPGPIKLLEGYQHQKLQGTDSQVGKIWKDGGIKIQYDIGLMAGNYAKQQRKYKADQLLWNKQQKWHGEPVELVMMKDRQLYISFPKRNANFYGKVKEEQDLVDALLMVLTYVPTEEAGE